MNDDEDEFNYSDLEDEDDHDALLEDATEMAAETEEHQTPATTTKLIEWMLNFEWPNVLARIQSHPWETRVLGAEGRTPLHIACDNDAPAVVVAALLKAYPEASALTGTANMNPLHITCSSSRASIHVVRVLLLNGRFEQFSMRDVDGDTPLHAACRCGASYEVLETLLHRYPAAVRVRDYEGLTPLLRLWVRYFVILGDDAIDRVHSLADLSGELLDAWRKTELLLRCSCGCGHGSPESSPRFFFSTLHAAAAVDCPRAIVRIAARILPHLLQVRDPDGRTPLMIACQTPIFKDRDLSGNGFALEHVVYEEDAALPAEGSEDWDVAGPQQQPQPQQESVIGILLRSNHLGASHGAALTDPSGRLPLHIALESGKQWHQGIWELVECHPDSVKIADQSSQLLPYQLAASKGDLSTSYELLRRDTTVLKHKKPRKRIPM